MLYYLTKYTITYNILYTITSKTLAYIHDIVYNKGSSREQVKQERKVKNMANYKVTFQYSETIYCTNIAVAETKEAVEQYYSNYEWYKVDEATEWDVKEAEMKGMPVITIERKEEKKMGKAKIENVEAVEMNNYKVTYTTGTEKIYPADKLPKTVAAWIEKNAATEEQEPEPATVETVEQDMEPATVETETAATTTTEQEMKTIPEVKQELEPVKAPVLDLVYNRKTGGLAWDITQYIVYPVAGLLLTVAAYGVGYLARLAYMLATLAGWMEPKIARAVAMARATASRIRNTANTALETVKQETPVIIEAVKAYTVAALEFRRDIISQDKYQEEF